MITTDQRESAERWFLERGLPYVLRPGVLVRRVWLRSAPALAAFGVMMLFSIIVVAVTGKHTIDIDGSPTRAEWFVLAVVVVVVPVASVAGWLVSRISDSGLRAATVVVSLALAALGAIFGGPSPHVLVDAITEAIVIAAILLCTASGVGAVLGWAVRIMLTNLASIGDLFVRALPVLLLTMLVFFNGPAWKMAATVTRGRLWLALLFLVLIAASFLLSGTMGQVRPILAPEAKRPEHAQMLVGTPFEQLPDRPRRKPLSKAERINVVFVLALSQFVRVLTVALSTGLIFLVFGLILISPNLLIELTGQGRFDGEILTMTLPIPQALIQMVMFLTALTFMYLAARAVGDKEYRAQYLDPLVEELLLTLVARDRYRTATATAT
ncbi:MULTISPECIES: hypothetical protein [Mycobacteriaceae]|uniref:Uncharacterized protein n=1 Tax=Mycolicibacterium parafortuitum TaxID=39692 RepID=A0ACC6MN11_MYCPF|nr:MULTISPECIES: hypothetical protein [Mycobacteriaceae]MDZ5088396.1 hypothetical protein [Mycolicibacterium parafortuitum]GFM16112.1 uncharacterized protein PO1_contig-002-29 [Mycobacterium sp. PO1]GFM26363.1 uncharacterized protein PO2_contig-093-32 [Mycobacterium sp. PO2]